MPPAAARSTRSRSWSGSVIQTPRRRSGASGRSGSASMSASSAAVRDPSDPSAKHFCQPIRARPRGFAPRIAPLRRPPASAVSRRVVAQRGQHADRQPLELGQARVGGVRPVQLGVRREWSRIVRGDDAERQERERDGHDPALEICAGDRRDVARDQPGGGLVQDTLGRADPVSPDHATAGVRRRVVQPRRRQRGPTGEQGMVVVRPERGATARRDGLQVVGGGPADPSGPRPSRDPRARHRDRRQPRGPRRFGPAPRQAWPHRTGRSGG